MNEKMFDRNSCYSKNKLLANSSVFIRQKDQKSAWGVDTDINNS